MLLCALILLTGVSCTSGETTETPPTTDTVETEKKANITDQKFSGEDFNVIYMTGGSYGMGNEVDYSFEETGTTSVSFAVYDRNMFTEEHLDITINGTFVDPAGGAFNPHVMNLVQSGDSTYDTICSYLMNNYELVTQNALLNLRELDSIHLDNPWWDKGINENFTFFGSKQFFATGDICIDDDCTVEVMYFSKKLHDENNVAYPYDDVRNGVWTIDKLVQNMEIAVTDLNGDGQMDNEDIFGMSASIGIIPAMMVYLGAPSTVIDEEGCPQFAYSYHPEKMVNTFDVIYDALIVNPAVRFIELDMNSDYAGSDAMFCSNQLMYRSGAIGSLQGMRDKMDDGFGIIPFPKLNEEQENYISNGSMCASTYAIPVTAENPEHTAAILDVMGYYSVDTITETVIQDVVMIRNTRDEISEEMLRFAIANKTYDIGTSLKLASYTQEMYKTIDRNSKIFVSTMESIQPKFEADVATLIEVFGGKQ